MIDDPKDFYFDVYKDDLGLPVPFGRIQWKGTDVCMDVYCVCGASSHIDTDFFYFFTCWACKQNFAVGEMVTLIPLTAGQSEYVVKNHVGFKEHAPEEGEHT